MSESSSLILLPAFMSTKTRWAPQIETLADIVEIDVVELTAYDSISQMAEAVLDQAPERFALPGLSLGGFTAFEIMRLAPERVVRLALVSTSARSDSPERLAMQAPQIEAVQGGRFAEVVEGFLKVLQSPSHPWPPQALDIVREMVHDAGPECFLRQQKAMISRADQRSTLAAIQCPTLVLHGRDDQSWPLENGEELARLIPSAHLSVIEDYGDFPTLDHPAETTEALCAWLQS